MTALSKGDILDHFWNDDKAEMVQAHEIERSLSFSDFS